MSKFYCLLDEFRGFVEKIKPHNTYSQFGEDGIIEAILKKIGHGSRFVVETGASDGLYFSNSRLLIESENYGGVLIEGDTAKWTGLRDLYLKNHKVRCVNRWVGVAQGDCLDDLLISNLAPQEIDLLVIDVDGQDYWLFNSLLQYRPRLVMVEYDPDALVDYIPLLGEQGQAGLHAIIKLGIGKLYKPVCATDCNVIFIREDLADALREIPRKSANRREQVFAAGRWQDVIEGQPIDVVNEDEKAAAEGGELPYRVLESTVKRLQFAVALSTPRIGFLDSSDSITEVARRLGAPCFRGFGISWSQALTRSIQEALAYKEVLGYSVEEFPNTSFGTKEFAAKALVKHHYPDESWEQLLEHVNTIYGDPVDLILTADYDSYPTENDVRQMVKLMAQHPECDALVPWQMKRGAVHEILANTDGPVNMTNELIPIISGHFGFTLFRREFFEKLDKPWFLDVPDKDGQWGDGRIDADMYFWQNGIAKGLRPMLATKIIIGHGEEVISWGRMVNGKIEKIYQPVNDWMDQKKKPDDIGLLFAALPGAI